MDSSPLTNHLLEFLGEPPMPGSVANPTTLLRQGQAAQEWLLSHYLTSWLELIGGLVEAGYPKATAFRSQLRANARLAEYIDADNSNQVFCLESIRASLQSTLRMMGGYPSERDMQWGVWARDVPMSIAYAFDESEFMDAVVCESIAPCCMYAAFLVSHVVEDAGVAEEIASAMFEQKPRALVEILRSLPTAPEA
jgi:hypothetical protein